MQNSKKSGIPVNGHGSCKANDVVRGMEYEDKYIYCGLHFATIKQEIPSLKVKRTSRKWEFAPFISMKDKNQATIHITISSLQDL